MQSVSKMGHTFLFEEGLWKADGFFRNALGQTMLVKGRTTVVHEEERWVMTGFMEVEGEGPARFENRYTIEPFEGRDVTGWISSNPDLGTLRGNFAVVGDSILSVFSSEEGCYTGMEYMRRIDGSPFIYTNRGTLLKEGRLVSSWSVTLQRL